MGLKLTTIAIGLRDWLTTTPPHTRSMYDYVYSHRVVSLRLRLLSDLTNFVSTFYIHNFCDNQWCGTMNAPPMLLPSMTMTMTKAKANHKWQCFDARAQADAKKRQRAPMAMPNDILTLPVMLNAVLWCRTDSGTTLVYIANITVPRWTVLVSIYYLIFKNVIQTAF